jgi:hypothetical protein
MAFGLPFLAAVLIESCKFFFHGVHGNDGAAALLKFLDHGVDVFRLGAAIRAVVAFVALTITLQALALLFEELGDAASADFEALRSESGGKFVGAFAD